MNKQIPCSYILVLLGLAFLTACNSPVEKSNTDIYQKVLDTKWHLTPKQEAIVFNKIKKDFQTYFVELHDKNGSIVNEDSFFGHLPDDWAKRIYWIKISALVNGTNYTIWNRKIADKNNLHILGYYPLTKTKAEIADELFVKLSKVKTTREEFEIIGNLTKYSAVGAEAYDKNGSVIHTDPSGKNWTKVDKLKFIYIFDENKTYTHKLIDSENLILFYGD